VLRIDQEAGPGVAAPHCIAAAPSAISIMMADVDIIIVNLNEPPCVARTTFTGKQLIKIKLEGVKSNRSAIGARSWLITEGRPRRKRWLSQSAFSCNDPSCTSASERLLRWTLRYFGPVASPNLKGLAANRLSRFGKARAWCAIAAGLKREGNERTQMWGANLGMPASMGQFCVGAG